MANQNNFLTNVSVVYRYMQKYFDRSLLPYGIGSGQVNFLFLINEHEGITMQQLAVMADCDKGTTTKAIQKLTEEGYVEVVADETDKRVRRLFTTKKTGEIINELYRLRKDYCNQLLAGLDSDETEARLQTIAANARNIGQTEDIGQMRIGGLQKLTLLDFPGQVACTIFTAGCNIKCPFCHNRDLVFIPENFEFYKPEDILEFLKGRKGILDGVAITGGEPLIQPGLMDFVEAIRNMGYKVKVDTNGFFPDRLQQLVESGLVDYIAMDIKNSFEKYPQTVGMPANSLKLDNVKRSVNYLLEGNIDYEFRTTVVRELHTQEDIEEIARNLKGARRFYLQQFVDSGRCIEQGYSSYDSKEMKQLCEAARKYLPVTEVRGTN